MEDFFCSTTSEVCASIKHLLRVSVNVFSANLCKLLTSNNIALGAGRGAECKGVGKNCREHEASNILWNLDAVLVVEAIDDGAGAANRDVSKGNWVRSLNGADAVVINNLHDLCLLKTINCLSALVVVNKNDMLLARVQKTRTADKTCKGAVLVDNREEAVP